MSNELSQTTWEWMHALRIPVSKRWFRKEMEKHPDYPSLISITDTLTALGIENMALEIEKEALKELPVPFLAFVSDSKKPFEIVTATPSSAHHAEFYKKWRGIVVAAEKPDAFHHPENMLTLRQEKKERYLTIALSVVMAALSLLAIASSSFSLLYSLLIISSLAGIGISLLIVLEALGIGNGLTHRFCVTGKNTDCMAVIGASGSQLIKGIGWSDIGIIYFVWQWLMLLMAGIGNYTGPSFTLFTALALCSIPFILFSIYYQYKIAGKWCILCLSVLGILLLQCASLLSLRNEWFTAIRWKDIYISGAVFAGITATWFLLQSLLKATMDFKKELAPALRFKNNIDIFLYLLRQQHRIDITVLPHELELTGGNGPIRIIVACNPYCQPCAEAHNIFDKLLETGNSKVNIAIRFALSDLDINDKKTKAVSYLLQVIHHAIHQQGADREQEIKKILHDWFTWQDLQKFSDRYPVMHPVDITQQLQEHFKWAKATRIPFTPTIFINGHAFPEQYDVCNLPVLIRSLLNDEGLLNSLN